MLKDFFYFSKGQRLAIILLLVIVVLTITGSYILQLLPPKESPEDSEIFLTQSDKFMKTLQSADSIRKLKQSEEYYRNFAHSKIDYEQMADYKLFRFDPNIADSIVFARLGLKPWVIKNILRYRSKGGNYKTPDDFAKVWGLTEDKFLELKPYIEIESKTEVKTSNYEKPDTASPAVKQQEFFAEKPVNINTADTAELMTVKGIGRKYANGIVKYRSLLGGYSNVEQVLEVYGMTTENFEKIKDKLTVNAGEITKIDVNKAGIDRLRSHPYLNYYQAKAVYELRRRKVKLKGINELNHLDEFTPEQLIKVSPYLKFD